MPCAQLWRPERDLPPLRRLGRCSRSMAFYCEGAPGLLRPTKCLIRNEWSPTQFNTHGRQSGINIENPGSHDCNMQQQSTPRLDQTTQAMDPQHRYSAVVIAMVNTCATKPIRGGRGSSKLNSVSLSDATKQVNSMFLLFTTISMDTVRGLRNRLNRASTGQVAEKRRHGDRSQEEGSGPSHGGRALRHPRKRAPSQVSVPRPAPPSTPRPGDQ